MTSFRALALVVLCAACGDKAGGAPTASASAALPPSCSETLPQEDRVRRCQAAEPLCCTAMMSNVPKDAADYWDKLAMACRGGAETSCQVVRDSDQPALYKLDAIAQGCTITGRWMCRTAAMLSLVAAPDRAPTIVNNYCRQTDDTTFRVADIAIDCKKVDFEALAPLKADADACRTGAPDACRRLAGVDGGARLLFEEIAWGTRGLDPDQARQDRVSRLPLADAKPAGNLRFASDKGDEADKKAIVAALEKNKDQLSKCNTAAIELDDPVRGKLRLALTIDKTGRVATTRVEGEPLDSQTLTACLRGELQDIAVGDPGGDVRAVEITISPSK